MSSIYNTSRASSRGRGRGSPMRRPVFARVGGIPPPLQSQAPQTQQSQTHFQDFQLKSSGKKGKNHLMEFIDPSKKNPVDMKNFIEPVKMHRKDAQPRLMQGFDEITDASGSSTAALGQPQHGPKTGADTSLIAPMGGAARNKQMLFKKRTKQIYLAKEDTRKLKEEAKPWILEDDDGKHSFTGTLEGGQSANYVFFIIQDNVFKVVPVDRWYKFRPKRNIRILSSEEVEEEGKKPKTGSDRLSHHFKSDATGEDTKRKQSTKHKIVDNGESLRDDDEDQRSRHDSDVDDLDFEDVFEDDEEGGAEHEVEDEDIKDSKERVKKEVKGYAPGTENDDDKEEKNLTLEGKQIKKLMRSVEKNGAYESDEEGDPYASSVEELDSEVEAEDQKSDPESSQKKLAALPPKKKVSRINKKHHMKGKKEDLPLPIRGRPTSPLQHIKREPSPGQYPSHHSSPTGNQSTSPRETSPSRKRKADETTHGSEGKHRHRHHANTPSASASSTSNTSADQSLITRQEVIDALRGKKLETKELLELFKKRLKKKKNREIISALLKEVARHSVSENDKKKYLELKPGLN